MRALVLTGPGQAGIQDVPMPTPGPGDAIIEVARVGVCGTDQELFSGEMAYLHSGRATYPLRPGHEWSGVVVEVGEDVDRAWIGLRVTGDTMLSCGTCDRCMTGRRHVCRTLVEVGVSLGFPGALAERLCVPAASLLRLPDSVDDEAGALVEPGGNAWRAAAAAWAAPGTRVLVMGSGTIGLLAAAFASAAGAEVHLVGRTPAGRALAGRFGAAAAWAPGEVPDLPIHAVIDATDDPTVPAEVLARVEPGGRLVLIGLAGAPSHIDTRDLVLRDITAVGLLGGSPGLAAAADGYARGAVDPHPLIGATVGLGDAPAVLAGESSGLVGDAAGPKVLVDPRR